MRIKMGISMRGYMHAHLNVNDIYKSNIITITVTITTNLLLSYIEVALGCIGCHSLQLASGTLQLKSNYHDISINNMWNRSFYYIMVHVTQYNSRKQKISQQVLQTISQKIYVASISCVWSTLLSYSHSHSLLLSHSLISQLLDK